MEVLITKAGTAYVWLPGRSTALRLAAETPRLSHVAFERMFVCDPTGFLRFFPDGSPKVQKHEEAVAARRHGARSRIPRHCCAASNGATT